MSEQSAETGRFALIAPVEPECLGSQSTFSMSQTLTTSYERCLSQSKDIQLDVLLCTQQSSAQSFDAGIKYENYLVSM